MAGQGIDVTTMFLVHRQHATDLDAARAGVAAPFTAASFRGGRIVVDCALREVRVDGRAAKLGGRAFDLLVALIERRSRLVGKDELLDVVWSGVVVEENNLEVQVVALRKILGRDAIVTVVRHGYRFTLEPDEVVAHGNGGDFESAALRRPFAAVRFASGDGADALPMFPGWMLGHLVHVGRR